MEEHIDIHGQSYHIRRLLGRGKGGYSYLAEDEQGQAVVVKQIHHESCDYYQFGDKLGSELRDYERLRALGIPMPKLLDCDAAAERIVKEYIPGKTVYEFILADELPEGYLEQLREMCRVLYPAGLNIDYFPTNFIPHGGVLYYVDYECNDYQPRWDLEHWGIQYWSKTPALLRHAAEQAQG